MIQDEKIPMPWDQVVEMWGGLVFPLVLKKNPYEGLSLEERYRVHMEQYTGFRDIGYFVRSDIFLPQDARILVIEPMRSLIQGKQIVLAQYFTKKARVDFVYSGPEALKAYEAFPDYDAVMMPMQIPCGGLSGPKCSKAFRKAGFKKVILLHTGANGLDVMDHIESSDIDGYATKLGGLPRLIGMFYVTNELRKNKAKTKRKS